MVRWTVQFIIDDGKGGALVEMRTVEAESHAQAVKAAYLIAPEAEFMMQVLAESPENFLGQVRADAKIIKGEFLRSLDEK